MSPTNMIKFLASTLLILVATMVPTSNAWSLGLFAVKVPFARPSMRQQNQLQQQLQQQGASAESLIMPSKQTQAPDSKPSSVSASTVPVNANISVDPTSFTLDESFRSSTVDLLYRQSLQRAGLE